ncbi:MAG: nucleotidyltransferase domain-containing protein [Chloroflexota bacterium]|nr:nucleotidyltransferase domain-containing protein [Chloroflexota bacterium]MDE2894383.1 nucleotidyltransferase domain-containing protein [Chloroflexota bacterium]
MLTLLTEQIDELAELCRRHHVSQLDLFGSAATENFDPQTSDLDFLVKFEADAQVGYTGPFFQLKEELERLFERPVDLVFDMEFRNPHFRAAVEESRTRLYEA